MRLTLSELFQRNDHPCDDLHDHIAARISSLSHGPALISRKMSGSMAQIDLQGREYVLDRPLELAKLQLVTLCNGTLIAGPSFPEDEFLIRVRGAHGLQFRNLLLECSKRANGISLEDFFRIRIEDCYLVHQKTFGIYSAPAGNNHELEIFKCHISEFLYGDGYPRREATYGVIPEFDIDANRVSTGIFLGQADNVVADCNINLCRRGIFSGMRANRIQGNHITGGGSKELELYKGIELDNFHKSAAMIVNNYVDNCCLWINCSADPGTNLRNYIHVTDNLFYRGYNHPRAGGEFHHIVVNPQEPNSVLANLHICDNLFYNQPANLEGVKPRVITPLGITGEAAGAADAAAAGGPGPSIDHAGLAGVTMKNNHFTNCFPTFVVPMGSVATRTIAIVPEQTVYRVRFDDIIPLGCIRTANLSVLEYSGSEPPAAVIRSIAFREVVVQVSGAGRGRLAVTASAESPAHERFDYLVH
jgi:hypothetical protein